MVLIGSNNQFPLAIVLALCGFAVCLILLFLVGIYCKVKDDRTKTQQCLQKQITNQVYEKQDEAQHQAKHEANEMALGLPIQTDEPDTNNLHQIVLHECDLR